MARHVFWILTAASNFFFDSDGASEKVEKRSSTQSITCVVCNVLSFFLRGASVVFWSSTRTAASAIDCAIAASASMNAVTSPTHTMTVMLSSYAQWGREETLLRNVVSRCVAMNAVTSRVAQAHHTRDGRDVCLSRGEGRRS